MYIVQQGRTSCLVTIDGGPRNPHSKLRAPARSSTSSAPSNNHHLTTLARDGPPQAAIQTRCDFANRLVHLSTLISVTDHPSQQWQTRSCPPSLRPSSAWYAQILNSSTVPRRIERPPNPLTLSTGRYCGSNDIWLCRRSIRYRKVGHRHCWCGNFQA